MYEKFAVLAFALVANVQAQEDYYGDGYGATYDQTPQPFIPDDSLWTYLTIPDDFGDFENNIDYVGVAFWFDGDDSDIFAWVESNYEVNSDFSEPTGDVFVTQVGLLESTDSDYGISLCFDHIDFDTAICATRNDIDFQTISVDITQFPEEDGEIDTNLLDYEVAVNTDEFGEQGAGIGYEFGHAYDYDSDVWTVWSWNADSEDGDFPEGDYDIYVIQEIDLGAEADFDEIVEYIFSDTIEIAYSGASILVKSSIAFVTVLYALI